MSRTLTVELREGRPWARALVYACAWLPLVAVDTATYLAQGRSFADALRGAMWADLPLAGLGLLALRATDALAGPAITRVRRLLSHGVLALGYAVTSAAITNGLGWLDRALHAAPDASWPSPMVLTWQVAMNALVYAALAGIGHARAQTRRAHAESMRAAQAEALRARADLALLRSQLNPHFVMNVLHSLLGLVRRDPELAEHALENLGDLLGYGLRLSREDTDLVPLRDEWSFVATYLGLEKMRLGTRLDLRIEAAPGTLDLMVPSFSLQPLVENSIVHAIGPRARGGRLAVTALLQSGCLSLRVQDDGPGLNGSHAGGTGLGLRLLRDRLSALYPGRDVLTLEDAAGGGLLARLDLPLEPAGGRPGA